MDKNLVKRLLESTTIDRTDLNIFIMQHTFNKLNRDISVEELQSISQYVQMGVFNLRYALLEAAQDLGLNVMEISTTDGQLLKTHVYEDFES